MALRLKNTIIFIVIGGVLIFAYLYFFKGDEEVPNLISTSAPMGSEASTPGAVPLEGATGAESGEFLSLLLNVRNIKLNDSIFADPAFKSLSDSTIILIQDGTEGRPNPFAPFGSDAVEPEEDPLSSSSASAPVPPAPPSGSTKKPGN